MKTTTILAAAVVLMMAQLSYADPFGSGLNSFDIEFVEIGNPGNPADDISANPDFAGSVAQSYRIGQFEISEDMINKANALGSLRITHDNRGVNKPATSISWFEAAQFVNWLNTSKGATPAYKFDGGGNFQLWSPGDAGYDPNNLYRNSLAAYFLPSTDEWYKAAFYNSVTNTYGDYPTANGLVPTAVSSGTAVNTAVYGQSFATGPADITLAGGLSPYGTMGQGGNVREWEETDVDLVNGSGSSFRGVRGGFWNNNSSSLSASVRFGDNPPDDNIVTGFRVASVPEPNSLLLGVLGAVGLLLYRKVLR